MVFYLLYLVYTINHDEEDDDNEYVMQYDVLFTAAPTLSRRGKADGPLVGIFTLQQLEFWMITVHLQTVKKCNSHIQHTV